MQQTLYVVQGFKAGGHVEPRLFETAERARACAVALGHAYDGVMLWRQTADVELGEWEEPAEIEMRGNVSKAET